ncbi:MAG: hypothetical protein ACE5KF_03700 [Kiloniellaceae bacterium]
MTARPVPALAPREAARRLGENLGRLTDLMETELEDLRDRRTGGVEDLVSKKRSAAKVHRDLLQQLADHPEVAQEFDGREREMLRAATQHLSVAVHANARALRAKLEANNCLMGSIAHAVRSEQMTQARYIGDGRVIDRPDGHGPDPVLFNQVA